jgi:hypothetical protein
MVGSRIPDFLAHHIHTHARALIHITRKNITLKQEKKKKKMMMMMMKKKRAEKRLLPRVELSTRLDGYKKG